MNGEQGGVPFVIRRIDIKASLEEFGRGTAGPRPLVDHERGAMK